MKDKFEHPCFNKDSINKVSRIHIPLVKTCNIQCNYCNRDYSCPNENRPGVSKRIIEVSEVYSLLQENLEKHPDLKIVGFAGPGDVLTQPEVLEETFKVIRKHFPELKLCLSTNGFAVSDTIDLLKEYKVEYITVTINALNPETADKIYNLKDVNLLLQRQKQAVGELTKLDTVIKINSVLIPGINEQEIIEIAKFAGEKGVFAQNVIPFLPVQGSQLEHLKEPSKELMHNIKQECAKHVKQLSHCKRCRADAVGNLCDEKNIFNN